MLRARCPTARLAPMLVGLGAAPACLSDVVFAGPDAGFSALVADRYNLPRVDDANQAPPPAAVAQLRLQLRDRRRAPLAQVQVRLAADGCQVAPAEGRTDGRGRAVAEIWCLQAGQRQVGATLLAGDVSLPLPVGVELQVFVPQAAGGGALPPGTPLNVGAWRLGEEDEVLADLAGHTLAVTSSDPAALLPPPVVVASDQAGPLTWPSVALLRSPGPQRLAVVDLGVGAAADANQPGRLLREEWLEVGQPEATRWVLGLTPRTAAAGAARRLTVAVGEAADGRSRPFSGRVRFASSDPRAELPPTTRFDGLGAVPQVLPVRLVTAGEHWLQIVRIDGPEPPARLDDLRVLPGAAASVQLVLPLRPLAGEPTPLTLSLADAWGNPGASAPPLLVTSSDGAASLPPAGALQAADGRVQASGQVVFATVGRQQLAATAPAGVDGPALAEVVTLEVAANPAVGLGVEVPATGAVGQPLTATLTALDARGRRARGARGQAVLALEDPAAWVAEPPQLSEAAAGRVRVQEAARPATAGPQRLRARVAGPPELFGLSPPVWVAPGPVVALRLAGDAAMPVMGRAALTLAAVDAAGNPSAAWAGRVGLRLSDRDGLCPPQVGLGAGAAAVLDLAGQVACANAGPATLWAWDAAGVLGGARLDFLATPAPPARLRLDAGPGAGPAHAWVNAPASGLTATLEDPLGRADAGFRGTAALDLGGHPASGLTPPTFDAAAAGTAPVGLTPTAPGRLPVRVQVAAAPPAAGARGLIATRPPSRGLPFAGEVAQGVAAPALALGADGAPHLAWEQEGPAGGLGVASWDGQAWQRREAGLTAGLPPGRHDQPSLAIGPGGEPVLAWRQLAADGRARLRARRWVGPGSWSPLGLSEAPGGLAEQGGSGPSHPQLASHAGRWVVAYLAGPPEGWQVGLADLGLGPGPVPPTGPVATPDAGAEARQLALAVGRAGQLGLVWTHGAPEAPQVAYRQLDPGGWGVLEPDVAGAAMGAAAGAAETPALAFDATGAPVVAWASGGLAARLGAACGRQIGLAARRPAGWLGLAGSADLAGVSGCRRDHSGPALWAGQDGMLAVVWRCQQEDGLATPFLRRWAPGAAAWAQLAGSGAGLGTGLGAASGTAGPLGLGLFAAADGQLCVVHVADAGGSGSLDAPPSTLEVDTWP